MKSIWHWLKDDKNRDILKITAAGLAAIVAAGWTVLTFVVDHHPAVNVTAGQDSVAVGGDIKQSQINIAPPSGIPTQPAAPAAKPR